MSKLMNAKGLLVATIAVASVALTGIVNAEDATGVIESLDPTSGTIVLDNGETYVLSEDVSIEGLQPGDTVTVSFEEQDDGQIMVTSVTKES